MKTHSESSLEPSVPVVLKYTRFKVASWSLAKEESKVVLNPSKSGLPLDC